MFFILLLIILILLLIAAMAYFYMRLQQCCKDGTVEINGDKKAMLGNNNIVPTAVSSHQNTNMNTTPTTTTYDAHAQYDHTHKPGIYTCPISGKSFGPDEAIDVVINNRHIPVCSMDCKEKVKNVAILLTMN